MFTFTPFKKRFSLQSSKERVDLAAANVDDIETSTDRRARTLKHLLKANHANHSIIYHNLEYNNHMPHILGAAYLLGGDQDHLNEIYENESKELEPWVDAPGEITIDDWQDFLGKRHYQRGFIDFFEDQLVRFGYDWQELVRNFLYEGPAPVVNNLIASLAHPLIHLGYAYELQSQTLAIEALAMACCSYNYLHSYIDKPVPPADVGNGSKSLLEILSEVREDKSFDGLFDHHTGSGGIKRLFDEREEATLRHWSSWVLNDPRKQFEESQTLAAALLVATRGSSNVTKAGEYDFFFVHLLTSSAAVRVLLPVIPSEFHAAMVRQWWLLALALYIVQGRPEINMGTVTETAISDNSWKAVTHAALTGERSLDSHYVKAIRGLKEAAKTWGDQDQIFLKAAVKFSNDFDHWGFGGT